MAAPKNSCHAFTPTSRRFDDKKHKTAPGRRTSSRYLRILFKKMDRKAYANQSPGFGAVSSVFT
ncbi:hypothetical protein HZC00_01025 [Candidatus Kaiserbacteria bacterium]|nr:hypothetical protein [Candidatus Kaiserbacteria bacterium]